MPGFRKQSGEALGLDQIVPRVAEKYARHVAPCSRQIAG
jgi:hypothetical protein